MEAIHQSMPPSGREIQVKGEAKPNVLSKVRRNKAHKEMAQISVAVQTS